MAQQESSDSVPAGRWAEEASKQGKGEGDYRAGE